MDCNSKKIRHGVCCRDEEKMMRCAVTALEKMKDMFGAALGTLADPSTEPAAGGCLMDTNCKIQRCPFRGTGVAPNVLQTFCDQPNTSGDLTKPTADPNAMLLFPGEVGLRGDRATFHMGQNPERPVATRDDGRPTGAVYYNVKPAAGRQKTARKHVMQVLPALPASANPVVGPVTGLPVTENETVFVLRLGKRYEEEPDEKARLQIEMRLPKQPYKGLEEAGTQFLQEDVPVENKSPNPEAVSKKSKQKRKKSAGKGKK